MKGRDIANQPKKTKKNKKKKNKKKRKKIKKGRDDSIKPFSTQPHLQRFEGQLSVGNGKQVALSRR